MFLVRFFSHLPFSVLYLLSDVLFIVTYYAVKYRREVVKRNLLNYFPDKSKFELKQIECKFYKNLADTSVDTIKLLSISEEKLLHRVKFDTSLTMKYHRLGWPVFGMTSHFCNWEWL